MILNVLFWILMGALSGWIASMIMGTNERQGLALDVVMGVAGALVGGFVMSMIGAPGVTGFNLYSLLVSVVGAVAVIALARVLFRTT